MASLRVSDALLIAAVLTGIALALIGLVDPGQAPLDDATAAEVNGVAIATDEFRSLLERRSQEGAPVGQLLGTLDDMIDEELLIQRALELGILRRDSNVRVAIIDAMEKSILNEERGRAVSEEELEAFYADNAALFSEPRRLQIEELVVSARDEVPALIAALEQGEDAARLAAASDSVVLTRLPPVPLSLEALARRYSQALVQRFESSDPGELLVDEGEDATRLIHVLGVREARMPPFDEVRISVLNELQMQRQDAAYDEYLAWLHERAEIRRNERLVQ
ncbi:MAG: peptidylprolyl isomerase [Halieaceae bacterium]|jgi:hypothetical protein|nr:peptidylprolyl isomerase [Halieaceae bacterium]